MNYICAQDTIVLPSLFEGFGLPLAEGHQLGCSASICTDLPSYREQIERLGVQEGVEVVPPGDAATLANSMQRELDRPPVAWDGRRLLAAHSSAWTWDDVARAVFAELAS